MDFIRLNYKGIAYTKNIYGMYRIDGYSWDNKKGIIEYIKKNYL